MAKAAFDCTNEQSRKMPLLLGGGTTQDIFIKGDFFSDMLFPSFLWKRNNQTKGALLDTKKHNYLVTTTYLEKQKTSSPDGDLVGIHQWQKVNSHQTNNLQVKEKNNVHHYFFQY